MTRVTVTGAALGDAAEGSAWLKQTIGDRERGAQEVRRATRIVNRALNALRAEARDPLVQEIGASRALAIRIGHGTGDELAEGRWTEASELPQPHARPARRRRAAVARRGGARRAATRSTRPRP